MKLITKFLLIYLFVSVIVLSIGGVISYYIIKDEIEKELKWEFEERIERVTQLLKKGKKFNGRNGINQDQNLVIRALSDQVKDNITVTDTLIWDNRLEQEEHNLKVTAYSTINGTSYYISTHGNMIESDDITEAVVKILLWILGLQVIGAMGIGYLVSGPLFKPFRNTLKRIREFQLNEKKYLEAEITSVKEFTDLNVFVEEMTRKAVSDYKNLKEFVENASHELQTPLSIAKGKLELLTETPLNDVQYKYVEKLEKTIKKLSRLSESLALLTKIENHEFISGQEINFSNLVREGIEEFREFVELNNLKVEAKIDEQVVVKMHPLLADILWTNLFQNAIRHNIENGIIQVRLTSEKLKISNTGENLQINPDELFGRFKKADQNSTTIGLGLFIIRRIVEQCALRITYVNEDSWHHVEITLKEVKTA